MTDYKVTMTLSSKKEDEEYFKTFDLEDFSSSYREKTIRQMAEAVIKTIKEIVC